MSRLPNNAAFLQLLRTTTPQQCRVLIHTATKDQIYSLCEIAKNICLGNVDVTPNQKTKLRQNKSLLYKLCDKSVPWKKKRRAVEQVGGFPPLLALLAPIIGGALGAATQKLVSKVI